MRANRTVRTGPGQRAEKSVARNYDLEGYRALLSPETRLALEAIEAKAVEDACAERFENPRD